MSTLKLGGRDRTLKLDVNALIAVEEKTGQNWLVVSGKQQFRLTDIRALVWAGCQDEELTIEEAGKLITRKNLKDAVKAVTEALTDFFVEPNSDSGQ
jgi:hypothetical protein